MGLCHILHCDKDCVLIQASAKIFENHHLKVQFIKDLLYNTRNSARCYVAAWMGREFGENGYMYMYG